MPATPNEPVDVTAIMDGIRRRVADKKARGLYTVDALAIDAAAGDEPWDPERVEALHRSAAIDQHLLVAPSDKPGLGAVVTRAKHVVVRAGFHNLHDVTGQITRFNAQIAAYATSLGSEITAIRRELAELRTGAGSEIEARVAALEAAALDARLGRLEALGTRAPAAPSPDGAAADPPPAPPAGALPGIDDLRLAAILDEEPSIDLAALFPEDARILQLRCGDGRLLERLPAGATGVDGRIDLVDEARRRGRAVQLADPLRHLEAVPAGGLDAVLVTGLVEELDTGGLGRLAAGLSVAVRPGGTVVAHLRNPRSAAEMARGFWRDPRRLRPLDPETMGLLLAAAGFSDVELVWAPPVAEPAADPALPGSASPSCAVRARR